MSVCTVQSKVVYMNPKHEMLLVLFPFIISRTGIHFNVLDWFCTHTLAEAGRRVVCTMCTVRKFSFYHMVLVNIILRLTDIVITFICS